MVELNQHSHGTRRGVILWTVLVGVFATLAAIYAFRDRPTLPLVRPFSPTDLAASESEFLLPHDPPDLPPGPHRAAFETSCTVCHSTRLVINQPPFPQKKWAEEVHKMVTAYGAPITPEEEPRIVEYLMTIRGRQE